MSTQTFFKSPEGEQALLAFYDGVLARWPLPYEPLMIETRIGRTFAIACGNKTAPPLVLLHGSTSNSATWFGDIAAYSAQFRVYAVDTPGEPGKSEPNRPPWDGPAYGEWLEDVLDNLRIDKAVLVGLSEGGWLALKFATAQPERVDKLVLLTPGGVAQPRLSWILRVIPLAMMGRWGLNRINRIVFNNQPIPAEVEEFMTPLFTNFKARTDLLPIFSDEELQQLTMPVLLLVGDKDAAFDSRKIKQRMQPLVPNLTAPNLPDAGHVLVNTAGQVIPFLTLSTGR
jgi:pimeloyl-ACP methyl ester carboxylesterase